MPGFGRFEAYEEFGSRGPYAVWRARPAGEGGAGRFVIKTFRTEDPLADAEVLDRQARRFVASAELQKRLAGAGWAVLHDSGRTTEYAYYVTDGYTTSVERLIETRAISKLAEQEPRDAAKAVVTLLAGVLGGLERLHATASGRGHGNLKGGNILVNLKNPDSGDLGDAGVALADPAADDQLHGDGQAEDLRALADILHRLVTGRDAPDAGSVQAGGGWALLGAPGPGEELRKLCEVMLNPQPGQAALKPAEVRLRLEACLKVKAASTGLTPGKKAAILGGVAALLIAAVAAWWFLAPHGPKPRPAGVDPREPTPAAWATGFRDSLAKAEEALEGVRTGVKLSGTEEQNNEFDGLLKKVEDARTAVDRLEKQEWPAGQGPDVDQARGKVSAEIGAFETGVKDTQTRVESLRRAAPVVKEDADPRTPDPANWKAKDEQKLKESYDAAMAELRAEDSEASRTEAGGLDARFKDLAGKLAAIRTREWPALKADASAEELKAAAESRRQIVAEAVALAKGLGEEKDKADRALRGSQERLRDYVSGAGEQRDKVVTLDRLREAYGAALSKMDASKLTWVQAKERVGAVGAWLASIEKEMPAGLQVPVGAGSAVNLKAAAAVILDARNESLDELVRPLEATGLPPSSEEERAKVAAVKSRLGGMVAEAGKVLTAAVGIEQRLGMALEYGEAGAEGKSIAALRGEVEKSPLYGKLEAAVDGVMTRARSLEDASRKTDPAAAAAALGGLAAEGPRASEAITLWRALVRGKYPSNGTELQGVPRLAVEHVTPVLAGVQDGVRRDALSKEVTNSLRAMWVGFVHERAGGQHANIDAAFKTFTQFEIAEADLPGLLEPFAKYNWERWKLIPRVEQAKAIADRNQQIAALQALAVGLRDGPGKLAGVGTRPEVQEFFAGKRALAPYIEGKFANFEEVGPGAPGLGAMRWAVKDQDQDNGAWVVYGWNTHTLRFRRVGASEEPASFVCTSEVSVGLFGDVVSAAGGYDELKGKVTMLPRNDQRIGPRAWVWDDAGSRILLSEPTEVNGRGWLRQTPGGIRDALYPAGSEPPPPTMEAPMNYVSPEGAAYMAALMGCRMPTASEWQAAFAAGAGDANRRDASWKAEYEHLTGLMNSDPAKKLMFQNNLPWPAKDAFRPKDVTIPEAVSDSEPAVAASDGALWFRPVQSGAAEFRDLVGNVAEMVLGNDEAARSCGALQRQGLLDAVRKAFKGADVEVVGASALSNGAVKESTAYPLTPPSLAINKSDLGFRLAFWSSAGGGGGGRLADRLVKILTETPYLVKGVG